MEVLEHHKCNAPIPTNTGTSLQRIYVGQKKPPRIYAKQKKYNKEIRVHTKRGIHTDMPT